MKVMLLMEDEPELRALLVEELEDLGYAVTVACDGAQGLAALEAGLKPDIVLTDIAMPVMTGLEFLAAYRERIAPPRAPVIAISAFATEDDIARAHAAGAAAYVRKPIDFDALETVVADLAPS